MGNSAARLIIMHCAKNFKIHSVVGSNIAHPRSKIDMLQMGSYAHE